MNETMKQENGMQESMDNSFYGKSPKMDDSKSCAIVGILRNQRIVLEENLTEAKLKFANASLCDDNWLDKHKSEIACKVMEGQIYILNKMEREIENMMSVI